MGAVGLEPTCPYRDGDFKDRCDGLFHHIRTVGRGKKDLLVLDAGRSFFFFHDHGSR